MFAPECRAFFSHPAYFGRSKCCLSDGVCLRYGEEGESDRFAIYFFPGIYDERIQARVGFYTQIAGFGASPDDVSLYNLLHGGAGRRCHSGGYSV